MADDERVLTRQGQDRKAELLRHAETLFTERGYADTRMIDIAKAAGVAKGLVYWYFESKEALLADIVVDIRDRMRVAQLAAVGDSTEPLDRICLGARASVAFVAEHWQLYGLIQSSGGDTPHLRDTQAAHLGDTVTQVELGQQNGTLRADESAMVLATAVQGIVNQLTLGYLRGAVKPRREAEDAAARLAVRAIAASDTVADEAIARSLG